MLVVVVFALTLAVLVAGVLFVLVFIDVTAQGPLRSAVSATSEPAVPASPTARQINPPVASLAPQAASVSTVPRRESQTTSVAVNARLLFSRDARHVRVLVLLITVGGGAAFFVRSLMIPEAFGERGPYRAAALQQIANHPSTLTSDATCLKCHGEVQEERAESPHAAVACTHCHGNGHEHMAAAAKAETTPGFEIPPAAEWDGDFHTKLDLFVTQDRATCLSCHTKVVGMPESFRSINVAEHLEEQGAEEVSGKNVCFECHTGHSPGI
ncbi:MAG: hypothetical protein R3C59_00515 [Planctomycetaceae bacterium]